MLPYRIAVLVFIRDTYGRLLLLRRLKSPNLGLWSPIGGKLEMASGESPFECAHRETLEETGLALADGDLHLFAMIAEKAYEGAGHWLLFLFDCKQPLDRLPETGPEGSFGFFHRAELEALQLPDTDRTALWPIYDRHRSGFVCLRAECDPARGLRFELEQCLPTGGADPLQSAC